MGSRKDSEGNWRAPRERTPTGKKAFLPTIPGRSCGQPRKVSQWKRLLRVSDSLSTFTLPLSRKEGKASLQELSGPFLLPRRRAEHSPQVPDHKGFPDTVSAEMLHPLLEAQFQKGCLATCPRMYPESRKKTGLPKGQRGQPEPDEFFSLFGIIAFFFVLIVMLFYNTASAKELYTAPMAG